MASGASRLQTSAVWRLVDFLLEGLVFLLIGQQVPTVVEELSKYETSTIVIAVAITVGVVLLLRPLWLVLTQLLPRSLHTRLGGEAAGERRARPAGAGEAAGEAAQRPGGHRAELGRHPRRDQPGGDLHAAGRRSRTASCCTSARSSSCW